MLGAHVLVYVRMSLSGRLMGVNVRIDCQCAC